MSQHRDYSSVAVYSRAPSVSTESGVSMHEDMEELELMLLPIVPTFSSIAVSADGRNECVDKALLCRNHVWSLDVVLFITLDYHHHFYSTLMHMN